MMKLLADIIENFFIKFQPGRIEKSKKMMKEEVDSFDLRNICLKYMYKNFQIS